MWSVRTEMKMEALILQPIKTETILNLSFCAIGKQNKIYMASNTLQLSIKFVKGNVLYLCKTINIIFLLFFVNILLLFALHLSSSRTQAR